MITTMWMIVLLMTEVSPATSGDDFSDSTDGDQSRKILGSSVVTSVSVIMDNGNGSKTVYTDSVGRPVGKPPAYSELASPINLLNPDRYEFYTFDDNGNLVRRLMSLEEIKAIIATGDSDGLEFDSMISESYIPEKKVKDVLNNVQDVLKEEMKLHKNKLGTNPIFDTPDVSDSWSMILPAVFGNSGADINPNKPMVRVTPDTITIDTQDIVHTTMKTIASTSKFDENPITQSVSTDSPMFTKEEMEDNNMATASYVMRQSSSEIMSGNKVPPTISTDLNIPYNQISMQMTDFPEVTENREESSSVAASSNIYVIQTTESMNKTETETTGTEQQTSPLTESNTELPEITQFSTWTPNLSTIPDNEEVTPMSLSTWRPDFSNNNQENVSSTSTTPLMATSSSSGTRLPSSEDPKTITPEDISLSTTPFMKFGTESNKPHTTEQYSQEMFTTPVQLSQTTLDSNQSSTTEVPIQFDPSTKTFETRTEVVEQTFDKSETTTEIVATTNVLNAINEPSTTDPNFMGSLQQLLSQTLYDVGGLVSSMNETQPMQNNEDMTKRPNATELENVNTLVPMNNSLDGVKHSDVTSTTPMPSELNAMVSGSTESTSKVELDTTTYFEKNNKLEENQTNQIVEITNSKVGTHNRPVLLNITILNSEENKKNASTLQHIQSGNVPIKNTKTEKGSETTTEIVTSTIEMITTEIANATLGSSPSSLLEENSSKLPLTSEITQFSSKGQTEITPSPYVVSTSEHSEATELIHTPSPYMVSTSVNSAVTELIHTPSLFMESTGVNSEVTELIHSPISYSSTETTKHPSIEILISENKTNYTSEKTETNVDPTDISIIILNDPQQNYTISNKFGENQNSSTVNTNIVESNENKKVTVQNISSNESDQTTEKQSIHTNTTESNLVDNESNIQKYNNSLVHEISSSYENTYQTTLANMHSKDTTTIVLEHKTNIIQNKNETNKNIPSQNHPAQVSSYQPIKEGSYMEESKKNMSNKTDNSGDDGDWTLVSTITPHPSVPISQKVQTPQQNYPDFIAPPTPIDLKAKPMQGFGLEDSTTSLDMEVYQFTQLCNELAFGFWKTVTSEVSSARSVFISPFGAISLLSMIFLGARGSTSGEMNEILKLDDMVTFNPHLIFKNVSESIQPEEPDSGVVSSAIVRELFSDKSKGKLLPFYKERARAFYDGFVEDVNFNEIGDVIRRRTNLQVKKYSKGKIREFLKDASLIARSPLAGISVNIFQTDCTKISTEGRDGELHFVVLPSIRQRRLVPIPAVVYKSGFLAGYEPSLDATAVSIGSKDQMTSTIFVISGQQGMPVPGDGLARLEKSLVESSFRKGAWSRLLRSLVPREGLEVQIPRIGHRSVINATSAVKKMGMAGLFDKQKADLSGMNGIPNELFLADLLQVNSFSTCGEVGAGDKHHSEIYPAVATRERRFLTLDDDEETFLEGEQTLDSSNRQRDFIDPLYTPRFLDLPLPARPRQARVPDTPRLRFDRPFLYFVRHNPTGLILHIGRFNPRLLP